MSEEDHPLQRLVNAMNEQSKRERANYHLCLGQAIKALETMGPDEKVMVHGEAPPLGPVGSYRGYYSDLAWGSSWGGDKVPGWEAPTVALVLTDLKAALDQTFEGYKGGDFIMDEHTPLWISGYGMASRIAVMAITWDPKGGVVLITKEV